MENDATEKIEVCVGENNGPSVFPTSRTVIYFH